MRRGDRELADRGEPYIVAMSFGCDWSGELPVLYFHCARRVCFELDLVMRRYGWGGEGRYQPGPMRAAAVLMLVVNELSGKRKS